MTEHQSTLFEPDSPTPLSRRTDPQTSKEAARKLSTSGALTDQETLALNLVIQHQDKTAAELEVIAKENSERFGTPYREGIIRKRLAGLRDKRKVVNGPARTCSVNGSNCMTWRTP